MTLNLRKCYAARRCSTLETTLLLADHSNEAIPLFSFPFFFLWGYIVYTMHTTTYFFATPLSQLTTLSWILLTEPECREIGLISLMAISGSFSIKFHMAWKQHILRKKKKGKISNTTKNFAPEIPCKQPACEALCQVNGEQWVYFRIIWRKQSRLVSWCRWIFLHLHRSARKL